MLAPPGNCEDVVRLFGSGSVGDGSGVELVLFAGTGASLVSSGIGLLVPCWKVGVGAVLGAVSAGGADRVADGTAHEEQPDDGAS